MQGIASPITSNLGLSEQDLISQPFDYWTIHSTFSATVALTSHSSAGQTTNPVMKQSPLFFIPCWCWYAMTVLVLLVQSVDISWKSMTTVQVMKCQKLAWNLNSFITGGEFRCLLYNWRPCVLLPVATSASWIKKNMTMTGSNWQKLNKCADNPFLQVSDSLKCVQTWMFSLAQGKALHSTRGFTKEQQKLVTELLL